MYTWWMQDVGVVWFGGLQRLRPALTTSITDNNLAMQNHWIHFSLSY